MEAHLPQLHVGFHRAQLNLEAHRVSQRAVAVGEEAEQIDVLVARARDNLPSSGQNVHLHHRFMRQAIAEACGFHAHTRYGAAERDGFQLRHHKRHESMRQGGVD